MLATLGTVALGFAIWLFVLRRYDRIEPESLRALLVAAFVGAGAFLVAAVANEVVAQVLGVRADMSDRVGEVPLARIALFCLIVGFQEEIAKAVGAIVLTRRSGWLDEPVDGMLYAMTVALGFAAAENLVYAQAHGSSVLLVRFLWPVPAHLGYAAVWGYGLARAHFHVPGGRSVLAASVVAAALLHGIANFALLFHARYPLSPLVSLAALVGLALLAHRRLRALVAESPFLEAGECSSCRNLNPPDRATCLYCGTDLIEHAPPVAIARAS